MEDDLLPKSSKLNFWLGVASLVAVAAASVVVFLYFSHFSDALSVDQETWGQFGDYVGGILNPLFSVMALFALLYTIRLQADTIDLQAREMKSSTAELRNSAEALRLQNKHNDDARFDSRLFGLLEIHQQITSSIEIYEMRFFAYGEESRALDVPYRGIRGISYIWKNFLENELTRVARGDYPDMTNYEAIRLEVEAWSKDSWTHIGRYIKSLANILNYVAMSSAQQDRVDFAVSLIRSNLSRDEQNLMFYCAIYNGHFKASLDFIVSNRIFIEVDRRDPFLMSRTDFICESARGHNN